MGLKDPVLRFPQKFGHPGTANCTRHYFTQATDHFTSAMPPLGTMTFQQRYYVCGAAYRTHAAGPIFFYVGNEADVTLYVNATGLMWESAAAFGALMVFAEHRYFGESLPFGNETSKYMQFLSTEQALADYATLVYMLRTNGTVLPHGPAVNSAFIGFGGSYGGMLASWLRIKYPSAIDGVIAASAPIESFLGESPGALGASDSVRPLFTRFTVFTGPMLYSL
jgi:lysosomal Pro-X carboxypeptidase